MAILLLNSGKSGETNKATLQRLAKDKGDTIRFEPIRNPAHDRSTDQVWLNGKIIGLLFESHEAAIKYLAGRSKLPTGAPRLPNVSKGKAMPRRMVRRKPQPVKRNPTDWNPVNKIKSVSGPGPRVIEFTNELGKRFGHITPDRAAWNWNISDGNKVLYRSGSMPGGGIYVTKPAALRSLVKVAETFAM